jgi:hypothetical protein
MVDSDVAPAYHSLMMTTSATRFISPRPQAGVVALDRLT